MAGETITSNIRKAIAVDKYEYKIRSEEIKTLIANGEYVEAAVIADTIDWRRVKSVMMLCTISDLYKINRRFEDARDMLLLAYDRHPGGRSIVYSLCELSIKTGEFVQAVEYYKEFVQVAPKDTGRYVLQYKLFEAQEVSLEERIAVLEELKTKDYSEKWAYELAYLYHRIGLGTKCVEECDELILWFGEGKYVLKAMELKMLHEPLTESQQVKYDEMKGIGPAVKAEEEPPVVEESAPNVMDAPTKELPTEDLDIQVKLMNVGQYDTINMQKELARNMRELWEGPVPEETAAEQQPESVVPEQASVIETGDTDMIDLPDDEPVEDLVEPEETKVEEVFFEETGEMDTTAARIMEQMKQEALAPEQEAAGTYTAVGEEQQTSARATVGTAQQTGTHTAVGAEQVRAGAQGAAGTVQQTDAQKSSDGLSRTAPNAEISATDKSGHAMPAKFEKILGMEYDGQIRLVMPEAEQIEKQITGQISLEDVLIEWEKMKKDSEQKRMEAVRQHVMQQTGSMFTEFEMSVRDGLLEKLEKGSVKLEDIENAENLEDITEETEDNEDIEEIVEYFKTEMEKRDTIEAGEGFRRAESDEEAEADGAGEEAYDTEAAGDDTGEEAVDEADNENEAEVADEADNENEAEAADEADNDDQAEAADEADSEEETGDTEPDTDDTDADEENDDEADNEEADDAAEETDEEEADDAESDDTEADNTGRESEEATGKKHKVRPLSMEEKQLFGAFTHTKKTREQIVYAIDNITMAAYTGNVIITGEEGMDTMTLAKNLIREVQQTDSNFSGRIAKISAESLNKKDIPQVLEKLANGALIVQKAGALKKTTVEQMRAGLEKENTGIIVVLEGVRSSVNKLLKHNPSLTECFNIRIDMEALDNDSLVAYGKKYAREQEYSIDELGVLALHTCIAERQTSDHAVTIAEVKSMIDDAIAHANRKTLGHFFDILVAKRYDEEDMIILREKDFIY